MLCRRNNLSFVSVGAVQDVTQEVDEYFEPRALCTLQFYCTGQEVLTYSTFSKVDITIQTEDVSITREVNLDVDS